jgi:ABC-2 type transport system permease protein
LTGTKREVYEFMDDLLPSTQYYQILQWSVERPVRFILCDVGIVIVMTGAGVWAFRRKDLK